VLAVVGDSGGVGVIVGVTVGRGVDVASGGGVASGTVGTDAAEVGALQALNPIRAARHNASEVFQSSFGMSAIILHFAWIFRL
jgi:hypothetical protein